MKQLKITTATYTAVHLLPTSYSELDYDQLITICYLYKDHLFELTNKQKKAMKIALFGLICRPVVPLEAVKNIPATVWVDLLPCLEWIFETPVFKEWPLPYLSPKNTKLKAPVEMLRTSSFWEMASMDDAFTMASNKKSVDHMFLIITILFRPERDKIKEFKKSVDWNGDVRELFNDFKAKKLAQEIRKPKHKKNFPTELAVAVFLYSKSFHENNLIKKFENLFPAPGKKEVRVGNNYGWPGIILEMSNTKFGNLEETKNQNWYTVLFEMSRQVDIASSKK